VVASPCVLEERMAPDSRMVAQPRSSIVAGWRAGVGVVVVLVWLGLLAPSALAVSFVYVTNSGSNTISGFRVGSGGSLTPVPGSPFPTGGALPEGVAISPPGPAAGGRLYVANFASNNVSAFRINADGSLTPVAGSPFPAGPSPMQPVVAPGGGRVYVTNHGSPGGVTALRRNLNGSLTQIAGSPFSTVDLNAFGIAITPDGRNLYAANENRANNADPRRVAAFSIAADGSLSQVPGSPFVTGPAGSQPIGAAVSIFGDVLYVANSDVNNVAAFRIGTNGGLTPVAGSPFPAEHPVAIAPAPNGQHLYVTSNRPPAVSAVTGFRVGTGGALTQIGAFTTGAVPQGLAIPEQSPLRLYASSMGANNLAGFSIGSTGSLSGVTGSPFATGGTAPGVFAVAATVRGVAAVTRAPNLTYFGRLADPRTTPHDLSLTRGTGGGVVFTDGLADVVPSTGSGCAARSAREVVCSTRGVTRISVVLGDGGDEVTVRPGIPTTVGAANLGADRIDVVNGIADVVVCGSIPDTVLADLQDTIQGTCGSLSRAAVDQFPTVRIRTRTIRTSRSGLARARLSCPRALRRGCTGRLSLRRAVGVRRGRLRTRRIGSARYSRIGRGRSRLITVRIAPRQLRALRRLRRTRGLAIAVERDRRGDPKTTIRLVRLRAQRPA
jgi:6-phosphogluconolactonase